MKYFLLISILFGCLFCKTKNSLQRAAAAEEKAASSNPVFKQELRLRFSNTQLGLASQSFLKVKLCEKHLSCGEPFVLPANNPPLFLVAASTSLIAAQVCSDAKSCSKWQTVLLHSVENLEVSNKTPQTSQSLTFTTNPLQGVSLSFLGDQNILSATYTILDSVLASKAEGLSLATVGLPNLGNTCFLNSTLQMFYHSSDFKQKLAGSKDILDAQANKTDVEKRRLDFITALSSVFESMEKTSDNAETKTKIFTLMEAYDRYKAAKVTADGIKIPDTADSFGKINSSDIWSFDAKQRDADEFIKKFSEILGYEAVTIEDAADKGTNDAETSINREKLQYSTVDLSFNPDEANADDTNMQKMINYNFATEQDGSVEHYPNRTTTRRLIGDNPPPSLTFTLQRTKLDSFGRSSINATDVVPLQEIDVPFIREDDAVASTSIAANPTKYKMYLQSAIIYSGSGGGGHYYTIIAPPPGKNEPWIKANDSSVTQISEADAQKELLKCRAVNYVSDKQYYTPGTKFTSLSSIPSSTATKVPIKIPLSSPTPGVTGPKKTSSSIGALFVGSMAIGGAALGASTIFMLETLKENQENKNLK